MKQLFFLCNKWENSLTVAKKVLKKFFAYYLKAILRAAMSKMKSFVRKMILLLAICHWP